MGGCLGWFEIKANSAPNWGWGVGLSLAKIIGIQSQNHAIYTKKQESRLLATQNVTPYIHTAALNHINRKMRTDYMVPHNGP